MRLVLELYLARLHGSDVRFRVELLDGTASGRDPDDVVLDLLRRWFRPTELERALVHSTSWRYDRGGVVLTYLAYAESFDLGRAERLPLRLLPTNGESLQGQGPLRAERRADGEARTEAILGHALRHLSFLIADSPARYAGKLRPETMRALRELKPAAAGRLPERTDLLLGA